METENIQVISLSYELFIKDELIEKTDTDHPFSFLTGAGNVLPKFEDTLSKLKKDEVFDFNLTSEEAYGPIREEAIVNVPIAAFEANGKTDEEMLVVGQNIPMQDASGNRMNGIIMAVEKEHVKMDFNHPLAGSDLRFKGRILYIRQATADELQHGHVHDAHSCDNCDDENCHDKK